MGQNPLQLLQGESLLLNTDLKSFPVCTNYIGHCKQCLKKKKKKDNRSYAVTAFLVSLGILAQAGLCQLNL